MKLSAFLCLAALPLTASLAPPTPVSSVQLTPQEVGVLLPDPVKRELKITYPIFRVYKLTDKAGVSYCILTESRDSVNDNRDSLNSRIRAVVVKATGGKLVKSWEVNDWVAPDKDEQSIWFWTKYSDFRDYDKDALIDPILIYGTSTANADEGRIKIMVHYRGKKVLLRHQAGVLDIQRSIQVDKAFYDLPAPLQAAVKQKLTLLEKNDLTILPHGWEQAMTKKGTFINDSYYSNK